MILVTIDRMSKNQLAYSGQYASAYLISNGFTLRSNFSDTHVPPNNRELTLSTMNYVRHRHRKKVFKLVRDKCENVEDVIFLQDTTRAFVQSLS